MPQMNEKNWMIIVAVVIVLIGSLIYNIISARNLKKKRQQFVESIQSSYTHMKSIEDTSKKIYEISNEINEMIREQKDTEEYIEKKKKEIEEIRQMIVTNDTILTVQSQISGILQGRGRLHLLIIFQPGYRRFVWRMSIRFVCLPIC